MGLRHFRCSECKRSFVPNPRLKVRQKTCGAQACKRKHRARYRRRYRSSDPAAEKESREKVKAKRPADFWKKYRAEHPESTRRNRLQSKLRARLRRAGLQRQLDITEVIDSPGAFDRFREFATEHRSLIAECSVTDAA